MAGYDICVIGGCGHVGLPLAIYFAQKGKRVAILDINHEAVATVSAGVMPFMEENADKALKEVTASGHLRAFVEPEVVAQSDAVILILGTPVDEHLNPSFAAITRVIKSDMRHFKNGQLVVLRSTVFPGTTAKVERLFRENGLSVDVVFCPERIAQGFALRETSEHPQIVSGFTPEAIRRGRELFSAITNDIVELTPLEAELTKLFTNVWRYIKFAIANEFYTIANDHGVDFYRVHRAMTHNYPRAQDLPKAGFAAGPCLFKDTMQLASFTDNRFFLGHAAMLINEGLPAYVVGCLRARFPLGERVVGILGMAFKADCDDGRESLSFKLCRILEVDCKEVLITDPYVQDERILPVKEVIARSDVLVLGTAHSAYRDLDFQNKPVIDIWNFYGHGGLIG